MKKHRVLRNLLIDIICAGLALILFALFHHVLPRQQQGLGIVIGNPYKQAEPAGASDAAWPEDGMVLAAAGASDVTSSATARGGKNGGRGNTGRGSGGKSPASEGSAGTI